MPCSSPSSLPVLPLLVARPRPPRFRRGTARARTVVAPAGSRQRPLTCVPDRSAEPVDSVAITALLGVLLVVMALLVAPERPADQEAICQRYNGVVACRVW
ncbi:hypothetical protein H8F24_05210 [Synechococcus sp. CBW1002]|uniref:hypothetical protein n=1 Tax=Synechococcus sp. CBW1002 TaxID=1353134 RepID=UPI0018CED616|nr:hypothetical protein [Synechococcus sp. CBW1002]QPN61911.1 hypothetical protein H8F24_05210 [Synechococcus sp. CBW1002]